MIKTLFSAAAIALTLASAIAKAGESQPTPLAYGCQVEGSEAFRTAERYGIQDPSEAWNQAARACQDAVDVQPGYGSALEYVQTSCSTPTYWVERVGNTWYGVCGDSDGNWIVGAGFED